MGRSAPSLQTLFDDGFECLIQDLTSGDGASLELWFRSMVHERWLLYLDTPAEPEVFQQQMVRLAGDLNGCAEVLRPACSEGSELTAKVLQPVCEDAAALATLAMASKPDDVLAAAVQSALARLQEQRMAAFAHKLPKCDIGREMLTKSALVLAVDGSEKGADAKFAQAQKLLAGDLLPGIVDSQGTQIVARREMVEDRRAFEVLDESLDLIQESIDLWSRSTQSLRSPAVAKALTNIAEHLLIVEGCYVLDVEVLLDSSGVAGAILDVPSRADVQAEEVAAQFACLHAELLGVSPKSRPVAEFVDRMVAMLRTLPKDVADPSSVDEMIKDTLMVVRASEAGRCQLVEAFRLMSDVFRLCDTTAASVYEEVKRCTTATDIAKTRLSKSVRLQQDVLLLKML